MKTIKLTFLLVFTSFLSFAQVGVGNTDPKASLDVSASNVATPANTDGVLIPRIDNFPATNPAADQDGMMVFVTGNGTPTKGFYYWDNTATSWVNVTGIRKIDDLTDGKSENNGTIDPSSLFIGYNAGASDDGQGNFNIGIGLNSLNQNIDGIANVAIGWGSLAQNTANNNTAFGYLSGGSNTIGTRNTAIGRNSLLGNTSGNDNTGLGYYAGWLNNGSGNIFIGSNAGFNEVNSNNVVIIENTDADENNALIYGEFGFDNTTIGNILRTNGQFQIGNPTTTGYAFPANDGTNGQVMTTDGAGNVTFQNVVGDGTGNDWSLSGNNALTSDFIGTINTRDLPFRSNNTEYLRLSTSGQLEFLNTSESIRIGQYAGEGTSISYSRNVFIGHEAARFQGAVSLDNVAIGHEALRSVSGSSNIAIGARALRNTTSNQNTAIGHITLTNNSTGTSNTALGYASLGNNTTGSNNVAIGSVSGRINSIGNNNTYIGHSSGYLSTGNENIFIGYTSGFNELGSNRLYIENSNADANNALIYGEFDNNILRTNGEFQIGNPTGTGYAFPIADGTNGQVMTTDGAGNVTFQDPIISVQLINNLLDGKSDNDGSDDGSSIFLGINAGASDDGTNNWNIGIGFEALQNSTSAAANIGIGFNALKANLTGNSNIGIGFSTMLNNTIGFQNTAIGNSAMIMNTTGRDNVANGHFSLFSNTYGVNNISIGSSSIFSNTGGSNNVGIGSRSLYLNNLGNGNIGIGGSTGYSNISGDFNIFLGFNSGYFETGSNKLYIENSDADADNALIYGEFDNDILRTNGELQIGNPTISGYSLPTADGSNGQVLTTDGAGNTSWQNTSSPTLSLARITMSVNQALAATGWQKQNFDTVDFDLNTDFDTVNDEFDVATTGYYRINASWRSNVNSTSINPFGIAIYVNGTIERAKLYSHSGNGIILRAINKVLDLNAGDRVEIYIYTSDVITAFANEIPVSFEIEQIR